MQWYTVSCIQHQYYQPPGVLRPLPPCRSSYWMIKVWEIGWCLGLEVWSFGSDVRPFLPRRRVVIYIFRFWERVGFVFFFLANDVLFDGWRTMLDTWYIETETVSRWRKTMAGWKIQHASRHSFQGKSLVGVPSPRSSTYRIACCFKPLVLTCKNPATCRHSETFELQFPSSSQCMWEECPPKTTSPHVENHIHWFSSDFVLHLKNM